MAGYNWTAGMSNNAVEAYDSGLVPASKIGRGIPAKLIREFVRPREWHHASKHFNAVDFFDPEEVLTIFGLNPEDPEGANPAAVAALAAHKAAKKEVRPASIITGTARWTDWAGSRNNPKRINMCVEGAKVERVSDQFSIITAPNGDTWRRKTEKIKMN
jgi:hypothetical protein